MADDMNCSQPIIDDEICETDGTPFYFTPEAIECLNRWVFLDTADAPEVSESLKTVLTSLNFEISKSEKKGVRINEHIVRLKIEIGEKASLLKSEVKYSGGKWLAFVHQYLNADDAKNLTNYKRIAEAKVDPKFYYLGIYRILELLTIFKKKKDINFNDFMDRGLDSEDIHMLMTKADEWKRHLDKRLNYYEAIKNLERENVVLTSIEDDELKSAIDNNYRMTSSDVADVKKLKSINSDVSDIFRDKKLSPLPVKAANELKPEAELANFREILIKVVSYLEKLETSDILIVEKELREDLVSSLNNAAALLQPQEDEQVSSSSQEES